MTATADEQLRRLDPRAITLNRLVGWIATATISGLLFITCGSIWVAGSVPAWGALLLAAAWLTVTIVTGVISYRWPELNYRTTSYKLDEDGIEIRTGVYWRVVIAVPRSRVQHIDVSQGPLERSYGLGTLIIYTAGTAHSRVGLSGLDHQTALYLRDRLLPADEDDAI
jgi:membrane protein YdbS with pleckstrin-like domain